MHAMGQPGPSDLLTILPTRTPGDELSDGYHHERWSSYMLPWGATRLEVRSISLRLHLGRLHRHRASDQRERGAADDLSCHRLDDERENRGILHLLRLLHGVQLCVHKMVQRSGAPLRETGRALG